MSVLLDASIGGSFLPTNGSYDPDWINNDARNARVIVQAGTTIEFQVVPNAGYNVQTLLVDGIEKVGTGDFVGSVELGGVLTVSAGSTDVMVQYGFVQNTPSLMFSPESPDFTRVYDTYNIPSNSTPTNANLTEYHSLKSYKPNSLNQESFGVKFNPNVITTKINSNGGTSMYGLTLGTDSDNVNGIYNNPVFAVGLAWTSGQGFQAVAVENGLVVSPVLLNSLEDYLVQPLSFFLRCTPISATQAEVKIFEETLGVDLYTFLNPINLNILATEAYYYTAYQTWGINGNTKILSVENNFHYGNLWEFNETA